MTPLNVRLHLWGLNLVCEGNKEQGFTESGESGEKLC